MENSFEASANIILSSLGDFIGIPDLQFEEEDHTCALQFSEDMTIHLTFEEEGKKLIIHSLVGTLPPENSSEIVEQLLEANLFWVSTRGATIALDRESKQVIIANAFSPYDANGSLLSGESLAKIMVDLAEINLEWRKMLKQHPQTSSQEESASFSKTNDALYVHHHHKNLA
jgi:hypothetical protein